MLWPRIMLRRWRFMSEGARKTIIMVHAITEIKSSQTLAELHSPSSHSRATSVMESLCDVAQFGQHKVLQSDIPGPNGTWGGSQIIHSHTTPKPNTPENSFEGEGVPPH